MKFTVSHIMSKYMIFPLILMIYGCSPLSSNYSALTSNNGRVIEADNGNIISTLLNTPVDQLWSENYKHQQQGLLKIISERIRTLANSSVTENTEIDNLLYYLRAYSYFGPIEDLPEAHWDALDKALHSISSMPDFYSTKPSASRLQEHYATTLHRFYTLGELQEKFPEHISKLKRLLRFLGSADVSNVGIEFDYALWETLRAYGFIAYFSGRATEQNLKEHLIIQKQYQEALLEFALSDNAEKNQSLWPLKNAIWSLSQIYNLYSWPEKDKHNDPDHPRNQLDRQVLSLMEKLKDLHGDITARELFTIPFLVNTFRGREDCTKKYKDLCMETNIDIALPIKHVCSDTLFIRAQDLTKEQLEKTCNKLTAQEDYFHKILKTDHKPTPNDFNTSLRVVVFDDWSQYNLYGQLIFGIQTNNGGYYVEGTPSDPGNQATFFSYEKFWIRPEFKIWNLNHEYIHYLDGRFVTYGEFGHFSDKLIWWIEGLAEFISKGMDNENAFKLLAETAKDQRPSLRKIFDTEYQHGLEMTYRWSYLAHRFIYERHPDNMITLSKMLKTDFFKGYTRSLDRMAEEYQDEFTNWLDQFNAESKQQSDTDKSASKPRKIYRHAHRSYLKPEHLVEDKKHYHR